MRKLKPEPAEPFTRGEYLCELAEIGGEATPMEADFGWVSFRFIVIKGRHKGQLFDIKLEIDYSVGGMRLEELAQTAGIEDRGLIEEDMDALFDKPIRIAIWRLETGAVYRIAIEWGCMSTEKVEYSPRHHAVPMYRPPCGEYVVQITGASLDTSDDTQADLRLKFQTVDGDYAGETFSLCFSIHNRNYKVENAARMQLYRITRALDIDPLEDTDQLIGRSLHLFIWAYVPWRLDDIAAWGCMPLEEGRDNDAPGHNFSGRPQEPTEGGGPAAA
jgi:hypothetical protein